MKSIIERNNLTYRQALINLINAKSHHLKRKGPAAMDDIAYKLYDWKTVRKNHTLYRFQAYIRIDGTTIRKIFSTTRKKEISKIQGKAWRFIFDKIDEYNSGVPVDILCTPDMTFKQYVENTKKEYLSTLKQSRENLRNKNSRINKLCLYFNDYKIREIDIDLIKQFRFKRLSEVANSTVNKEVALLSAFLRMAVEKKIITFNPCTQIKNLKIKDVKSNIPIMDYKKIFKAIWKDTELRNFCMLMFYTGLRPGDIIALKQEDIKVKNNVKYFDLIENKTGKNVWIPIHRSLIENEIISSKNYIFEYSYKRTNAVRFLLKKLKELLKKNNIYGVTLYSFRHTFQDQLEALNIPEGTIRHLMGKSHKDTLKFYSHKNIVRLKQAIEKLPKINFFTLLSHLPTNF